ncbi:MAG: hypothetical protein N838_02340 [Thiohalocapsa sp. PB-PSB1]|nr:MAG: hypothetical protein N838_02340 [Thiohalocapsa sp. PB-PSB1]
MSLIHRFGACLSRHVHYHCCIIDGVFKPVEDADDVPQSVHFRAAAQLTPSAVAAVNERARVRERQRFPCSGPYHSGAVRRADASESTIRYPLTPRRRAVQRAMLDATINILQQPRIILAADSAERAFQCAALHALRQAIDPGHDGIFMKTDPSQKLHMTRADRGVGGKFSKADTGAVCGKVCKTETAAALRIA